MLVACVIPLGILRNALRIVVIGMLCMSQGPHMIDSWIHRRGGPEKEPSVQVNDGFIILSKQVPGLFPGLRGLGPGVWPRHEQSQATEPEDGRCGDGGPFELQPLVGSARCCESCLRSRWTR